MRDDVTGARDCNSAKLLLGPGLSGPDKLLLPSQVEERFALTRIELASLRRRGKGPRTVRFGRFHLYPPAAIVEWLNAANQQAQGQSCAADGQEALS